MTTLYCDAVIHTGVSEQDTYACMAVKGGKIIGLYHQKPAGRFARCVSLGGQHVYPCLIDAHTHLLFTVAGMAMGFKVCEITDSGVEPSTLAAVEEKIRGYAAAQKKNAVIAATNYIQTAIDAQRLPTREELDAWSGGRPVVVYNIDGHSTALSSAMLRLLDIDPTGHSGLLQGEDNERVQGRLTDIIGSSITLPVLARGIAAFQNTCAEYGISVVGALEGNGDSPKDATTALLLQLARHFAVGVRFYFQYMDLARAKKLAGYQKHPRIGGCGDWELDGAIGSHSAAFHTPYADTGETAPCYYTQEFIEAKVRQADEAGFQIAAHAIGEAAIEQLAAALEKAPSGRLHRMEHGEFPSAAALEKMKSGRWAVMMQPGYAWIDKKYLHTYTRYLPAQALTQPRLKTLVEAGVCVCGSSDSPVQDMDPWLQMLGMVDFYVPEESVSVYEAFRAYTAQPARALLEQNERGTLEVGKAADFFTADKDLFALPPRQVVSFRPAATYYGGRRWRRRTGSVWELLASLLTPPRKV